MVGYISINELQLYRANCKYNVLHTDHFRIFNNATFLVATLIELCEKAQWGRAKIQGLATQNQPHV